MAPIFGSKSATASAPAPPTPPRAKPALVDMVETAPVPAMAAESQPQPQPQSERPTLAPARRGGGAAAADEARLRGNAAFAASDWDAALAAYTAALELAPRDARLHSNRAAAYIAKHRAIADQGACLPGLVGLAVADATAATAYRPAWQDGWYRLYIAHTEAGSFSAAVRALQMGIRQCQDADVLKNALVDVNKLIDHQHQQAHHDIQRRDDELHGPSSPTLSTRQHGASSRQSSALQWRRQPGKDLRKNDQRHSSFTDMTKQTPPLMTEDDCGHTLDDGFATEPCSVKGTFEQRGARRERKRKSAVANTIPVVRTTQADMASQSLGKKTPSISTISSSVATSHSSTAPPAGLPNVYPSTGKLSDSRLIHDASSHHSSNSKHGHGGLSTAALSSDGRSGRGDGVPRTGLTMDLRHSMARSTLPRSLNEPVEKRPSSVLDSGTTAEASPNAFRPPASDEQQNSSFVRADGITRSQRPQRDSNRAASDTLRFEANEEFRAGNWDKAIEGYTLSIQSARDSGVEPDRRALSNRSAAWLRKAIESDEPHAFEQAIADADRCIELDAAWPKAWFRKGSALLEDGRPAQARSVLVEGLKVCPNDPHLLEALRQADGVIAEEGEETDYEDIGVGLRNDASAVRHVRHQISERKTQRALTGSPKRVSVTKTLSYSRWTTGVKVPHEDNAGNSQRHADIETRKGSADVSTHISGACGSCVSDSLPQPVKTPVRASRDVPPGGKKLSNDLAGTSTPSIASIKVSAPEPSPSQISSTSTSEALGPGGGAGGERKVPGNGAEECGRLGAGGDASLGANRPGGLETLPQTLYEVLNVPPDASEAVIRRSYYLAARELHPDKNPDDPNATHKFQLISDAYQVLSNAETRAAYDKHGEAGLEKSGIDAVDPQTLFAIVFGSDQFADYIGELKLTTLAANVGEDGQAPSQEVLDGLQAERVQRLADKLLVLLDPWVRGDEHVFHKWVDAEMRRLADTNFGPQLLSTVGNVYVHKVDILRGRSQLFGVTGLLKDASYRTQKLGAQIKANSATNRVMQGQRRLHERVMRLNREGTAISEGEAQEVAAEMARKAVDMMWKISVLDIQSTLEAVVDRVLRVPRSAPDVPTCSGSDAETTSSFKGTLKADSGAGDENVTGSTAAVLRRQRRHGRRSKGRNTLSSSLSRGGGANASLSSPSSSSPLSPPASPSSPLSLSLSTAATATSALRAEAVRALGRAMVAAARRGAPAAETLL